MKQMLDSFRVGLFMVLAIFSIALSLYFSNWSAKVGPKSYYLLRSEFSEVGSLRIGAAVRLAGVNIGEVNSIRLDNNYQALVSFKVFDGVKIPSDSSVSIVTKGLLGGNYLVIGPGFDEHYLKAGQQIVKSHSAIILENLISQLVLAAKQGERNAQ